ncbi:MAG: response regulator [Acidobacteria bacterium]|nr:response regulator [Acidobacteriota bacterium]
MTPEKTILLVEDEKDIRDLTSRYLTMQGYRVVEAGDGEEAIALARSVLPALIMMDINLPKVDGITAAILIRRIPELSQVPIITNSADGLRGIELYSKERLTELGGGQIEYLPKPIDLDELEELLLHLLS